MQFSTAAALKASRKELDAFSLPLHTRVWWIHPLCPVPSWLERLVPFSGTVGRRHGQKTAFSESISTKTARNSVNFSGPAVFRHLLGRTETAPFYPFRRACRVQYREK